MVLQVDISALMNQHGEEMIDSVESDTKEVRARFTDFVNATVEKAVLKVRAES